MPATLHLEQCPDCMTEISLQKHLAERGWSSEYLSPGGDIARVGLIQGFACFESFGFIGRTLDGKRLLIHDALALGTKIKFLSSLKFDFGHRTLWHWVTHPFLGLIELGLITYLKLSENNLQNMPMMRGYVEQFENPPFSEFPFDQPLTLKGIEWNGIWLVGEDGVKWSLPIVSLATVTQIAVLKP